ncbi:MAG: hypothetical protein ACO1SV_27665 [Fimbriimonas sp.]
MKRKVETEVQTPAPQLTPLQKKLQGRVPGVMNEKPVSEGTERDTFTPTKEKPE